MTGPTVYGFTMIAGKLSWGGGRNVSAASRRETLESNQTRDSNLSKNC